jgi:hypothetical protein
MITRVKHWLYGVFIKPPRHFSGGFVLNLLGWHVVRTLYYQLRFRSRPRIHVSDLREREALEVLERDGIVVIPNFLPDAQFRAVTEECQPYFANMPTANAARPKLRREPLVRDGLLKAPLVAAAFAKSEFIRHIVCAAMRRPTTMTPTVKLEEASYDAADLGKRQLDSQDILHYDVSYPTVKCFFYLNDVSERNAPFVYARRSHRVTIGRLWEEYRMSVDFFRRSKALRRSYIPMVGEAFLRRQALVEEAMSGRRNTLIIANNQGLHRRGDFTTTDPRHLLIIDFRDLDMSALHALFSREAGGSHAGPAS